MNNFDDLKLATEAMSGGKNTVLLDDVGMPSIMVVIPKMNSKDLVTGATDETHPAFVVEGVEKDKVYISKYLNIVQNNRAYSLPMQDPANTITFSNAVSYCRNKGDGWGIIPFSLWGAIALWSKKNSTQPHGNTYYGKDYNYQHEVGVTTSVGNDSRPNRTATGSGPVSWNHDCTNAGICDLSGNVAEYTAGLRIMNGALQIVPYANCMSANCDLGDTSAAWKYIGLDGTYIDSGDHIYLDYGTETSKFFWSNGILNSNNTSYSTKFSELTAGEAVASSGKILLRKLTLLPEDEDADYGADTVWANNNVASASLPLRGGNWTHANGAGVFNILFSTSTSVSNVGFRSACYEL